MTAVSQVRVRCPACSEPGEALTYQSVNGTLYADQRSELLTGELLRWRCTKCGHSVDLEYPMLYHDMDSNFMIQWIPGGAASAVLQGAGGDSAGRELRRMKGYTFRLVGSFPELVEKVRILELGLDDRAVEVVKLGIVEVAMADQEVDLARMLEDPSLQPRFVGVSGEGAERTMMFRFPALEWIPGGEAVPPGLLKMHFSFREYERALESLKEVPMPPPAYGPFLAIDQDYIRGVMAQKDTPRA